MPSISNRDFGGSSSSGGGFSIGLPWKGVLGIAMIVFGVGYGVYQYERFNPRPRKPTPPATTPRAAAAAPGVDIKRRNLALEAAREEIHAQLRLTDGQKKQIAAIDANTTDPQSRRRETAKLLTPDQRKKAEELMKEKRDELRKKGEERRKQMEERRTRLYGPDAAAAAAKDKETKDRMKARREAKNGGAGPSPPAGAAAAAPGAPTL